MPLELHIWGPAFGLPSIDAHCLAAIALFRNTLPPNSWNLVASNDPTLNPFCQLPALKDGDLWVAGFRNICKYVRDEVPGARNLDADLNEQQWADNEALSSFLDSRGLPLIDLSLYVSSDNYTSCTRRAFSEMLSWPRSWTTPQRIREKARTRSEHLGLSALDVDAAREKQARGENEGLTAHIPKSLRRPKQTVIGLLGSNAQQARFRIDAVCAEFFEPLDDRIKNRNGTSENHITTVDCLAVGLLALMLLPDLPQPWLQETVKTKYPDVSKWASAQYVVAFGSTSTNPHQIIEGGEDTGLPWQKPEPRSWSQATSTLLESVIDSLPILHSQNRTTEIDKYTSSDTKKTFEQKQMVYRQRRRQQILHQEVIGVCLTSISVFAWLLYAGILQLPPRQPKPTRRTFVAPARFAGFG